MQWRITAGILSQNFSDTVKSFIANDEAFHFVNTIKRTPAYWKRFLYKVLAMVKQLGISTFFMTLSCADLHWNELISIIAKLKGENLQDEHMNRNPVLLARHFQSNSYKWALSKIPCNQGSLSSSWKSSYSFFFVDCKCTNFE